MTHIKSMMVVMAIAPATALVCWAIWTWML